MMVQVKSAKAKLSAANTKLWRKIHETKYQCFDEDVSGLELKEI
jgi:hypothetical protein